jgi:hypothetical protein
MKVGDMVQIKTGSGYFGAGDEVTCYWPESKGQIGVIVAMAKRLYIPAAKVMVLGEVAEFDIDELEEVNESR